MPHDTLGAKRRARVTLTCVDCGHKQSFPATAPELTACEAAHKTAGWSYQVGFFSMLTGDNQPRCAACTVAVECARVIADATLAAIDPDEFRDFEASVLSIGDEFLPACAIAARDTHTSTPEYRQWLAAQWEEALKEEVAS